MPLSIGTRLGVFEILAHSEDGDVRWRRSRPAPASATLGAGARWSLEAVQRHCVTAPGGIGVGRVLSARCSVPSMCLRIITAVSDFIGCTLIKQSTRGPSRGVEAFRPRLAP